MHWFVRLFIELVIREAFETFFEWQERRDAKRAARKGGKGDGQ